MEARSVPTHLSVETEQGPFAARKPRAKDEGVAAGVSAVIREVGDLLSGSGGLVVVVIGVIAVMTITSTAMGTVPEPERATVATAAFSVLGTIVGAFFGLRVGSRGKDEAEAARALAAAKVERLAAHVDADEAERVLDAVDGAAHEGVTQP
jgi:hypothetical protein